MFVFDIKNIALAIIGLITIAWGSIVYLSDTKNRTNRSFFVFTLSILSWILTMLMFRGVDSSEARIFWAHLLYFSAAAIPPTLLFFAYVFTTETYKISLLKKVFIFVPFTIAALISLTPSLLIRDVVYQPKTEDIIIFNNWLHIIYAIYINLGFAWIYFVLGKKWWDTRGITRTQIGYVILGALGSTLVGVTTNLTLPLMGNFTYNWLGQVTMIIMVTAIFYSILRHQLFDAKVVATAIFVFALWGFILFRTVLAGGEDLLIDTGLLLATIIVGLLLIRSVIKEVRTREQLAIVNKQLERLNLEKSEFLSIATHQLKTPITEVRNATSMLLEGSFGEINPKAKEILGRVFDSAQRQNVILDDFLNVSRIDQGRMKYDFGIVDVKKLMIDVVEGLRHTAEEKHLTLTSVFKQEGEIHITADYGKIRQIVTNLVDNAIKYSTEGRVEIIVDRNDTTKKILISVKDTGIGMDRETIGRLFKRFSRAKDVGKIQVSGSGLGLYIAKEMVRAHGGRIWAESEGLKRGSLFNVELPFMPPDTRPLRERERKDDEEL